MNKPEANIDFTISTYVINLFKHPDSLSHIKKQFDNRNEFTVNYLECFEDEQEAIHLWRNITKIVQLAMEADENVIIICKNTHEFTPFYSKQILLNSIIGAAEQGVNILFGGIGVFGQAIPVTKNRFWIDTFQQTPFIILFRPIFELILRESFTEKDTVDLKLSEMTSHKMVMYPYISVRKKIEDSISSSLKNDEVNNIDMFDIAQKRLSKIDTIAQMYQEIK
ncbi:hypothetical protein [Flavobacterium undicola]|uniref:hypothetical protein n=1 Tax=Flavobacterium undicola TaxID=1932779 RepID=UPI0013769BD2|nr:hypothetical protein [Flavobacterium undicola]MBA0883534.1 hypothetical protein [Flavobacterium undicola]